MYQALYRKWRSRTFDQVVGQDHVTQIAGSGAARPRHTLDSA